MDCSECQGTGYVLSIETIFCRACDSTGKLLDSTCICCDGAGEQLVEIKVLCDECEGTGKVKPLVGTRA